MTIVDYGLSWDAWANVISLIERMIEQRGFRRIVEIGGGANPTLSLEFVERHGLDYALLDISQTELDKAPTGYVKILADISAVEFFVPGGYDFAFSRMLAEHVSSGVRFHRNVRSLLRDGGVAFHFFPTLFAPPFVVNYLLPETLAERLLHFLQPGRERSGKQGKFPARYSWCRGPLKSQIKRFESVGFMVEKYSGFFGHPAY
ncbi:MULTISPECIES: class I SAM-dependent methyltransferase [Methylococcus]|uniref:Class I SAM-dependent methyltransferase n=1 Tax=Methylococcus capsulatus TaxID=414 RepID=A0ABZ2F2M9_METCP|nr:MULTISPECIES: class I SAM-dependent methyltransferase [Methylococcus]MDF9393871.1 class I SAM-dependent methyltransferase [Methylococcus capsulatus]